jgi:hypothetical protein
MQLAPWPPPKVRPLSEERVLYVSDDVHATATSFCASVAQYPRSDYPPPMPSAELSRRVEKGGLVIGLASVILAALLWSSRQL